MSIGRMREVLADISGRFHLDVLATPRITRAVDESLDEHGRLGGRRMPLGGRLVFWLVLVLALERGRSVPTAFGWLIEACRGLAGGLCRDAVTESGLARARQRIGPEPVRSFFARLAAGFGSRPSFHGRRPVALDGVRLTMPDTQKNRARFPLQKTGRGRAAWPQMLAVCLVDVATHWIVDASFDNIHTGERELGRRLWPSLRPDDLLVEDRGFFKVLDLWQLDQFRKQVVCKLPASPKFKILQECGPGDYLVEFRSRRPREQGEAPDHLCGRPGKTKKLHLTLRLIAYKVNGVEHRLVTNVFDGALSVADFARVYHWRWDAEIAYDELKVHLMTVRHGQAKTVFRSRSPRMVEQEFWAMLSVYNLVRGLMAEAGAAHGVDPLALSFTGCLAVLEDNLITIQRARVEELPLLRSRLLRDLARSRIDRPRRQRQWPRVVKVKMSNFRVKKPYHRESDLTITVDPSRLKGTVAGFSQGHCC